MHYLYICTTCKKREVVESESVVVDANAGEALYHATAKAFDTWSLKDQFTLIPTACLSGCKKASTFALQAPGKFSYIFGHIDPIMVESLLEMAATYASKADGVLKKIDRPDILRDKVLARVPPLRS